MRIFLYFKKRMKMYLFIILFLLAIFATYIYLTAGQKNWDKSLVLLAGQFLRLKISLLINSYLPIGDIADYKYNFYLYFGPFASILLMPFVAMWGISTPQYIIGIISLIACFILVYLISKKFELNTIDSLWLALFFDFSSVLFSLSVMNISAYQVEALGAPLLLLSLYEYFTKKRGLIIGIFLGLAVMTRFTLLLSVSFFIVEFIRKRITQKGILFILIPIVISCILLGFYNQRRFHSFFETGYSYNISLKGFIAKQNLKHGVTNVSHIPANLYSFLIMSPQPLVADRFGFYLKYPYLTASNWGMAIWYTSPLFLLLIFRHKRNKYFLSSLIAVISISIPLFTYYSIGGTQFGYRYAIDFLPFLLLLLIPCIAPKLSKTAIALIIIGVLFNLTYSDSLFGVYPLLNIYK